MSRRRAEWRKVHLCVAFDVFAMSISPAPPVSAGSWESGNRPSLVTLAPDTLSIAAVLGEGIMWKH